MVNFRQVIEKYVKAGRDILDELLEALAEAVSLDKRAFLQFLDSELSEINVRVNYYPPCPKPDSTFGIPAPHRCQRPIALDPIWIHKWTWSFQGWKMAHRAMAMQYIACQLGRFGGNNEQREVEELVASGHDPVGYGPVFGGFVLQPAGRNGDWARERWGVLHWGV